MRLILTIPLFVTALLIGVGAFRVFAPARAIAALDQAGPRDWFAAGVCALIAAALVLL